MPKPPSEVGQQLSKKLGIPFYDKEILARVAEESDMSEEFVKNHEENAVYSHINGTIDLNDAVFGVEVNEHLVHMAVVNQLANKRQGTQKAKTRSEVRGGGRKPWRQKCLSR